MFLDELKLSSELTEAANNAAALPSRDVSREAMYFGILTNKILPGATVLGFSRSGDYFNQEFLNQKSEAFALLDVDFEEAGNGLFQANVSDLLQGIQISSLVSLFTTNRRYFRARYPNSNPEIDQW